MKPIDRVLCVTPAVLGLAAFIAGLRTEQGLQVVSKPQPTVQYRIHANC